MRVTFVAIRDALEHEHDPDAQRREPQRHVEPTPAVRRDPLTVPVNPRVTLDVMLAVRGVDLSTCKEGSNPIGGQARFTVRPDGTVERVTFEEEQENACVREKLSAIRVDPFAGSPQTMIVLWSSD